MRSFLFISRGSQNKNPRRIQDCSDEITVNMTSKKAAVQKQPEKINHRPDWDTYFLDIVDLVSRRSTCRRRAVGAGLVRDRRILATGYNGAPSSLQHCLDIGCLREQLKVPSGERHELCRGLHAEQNVIIQAALHGVITKGSTLYCTNHPCVICAKMIINAGIVRIVIRDGYHDKLAADMLQEAGIDVAQAQGINGDGSN